MRLTTAVVQNQHSLPLPQGWFLLGAALTSWALLAAVYAGTGQVLQFLLAAL